MLSLTAEPIVARPNEILTMHFGPQDVLVALSIDFVDTGTAAEVERAVTRIERKIKAAHPEVKRVFVEAQDREAHRSSQPPFETEAPEETRNGGGRNLHAANCEPLRRSSRCGLVMRLPTTDRRWGCPA